MDVDNLTREQMLNDFYGVGMDTWELEHLSEAELRAIYRNLLTFPRMRETLEFFHAH
jgi:hypothetical protein